jgi:hypothetical protein
MSETPDFLSDRLELRGAKMGEVISLGRPDALTDVLDMLKR